LHFGFCRAFGIQLNAIAEKAISDEIRQILVHTMLYILIHLATAKFVLIKVNPVIGLPAIHKIFDKSLINLHAHVIPHNIRGNMHTDRGYPPSNVISVQNFAHVWSAEYKSFCLWG
jgi:hypothetical protein